VGPVATQLADDIIEYLPVPQCGATMIQALHRKQADRFELHQRRDNRSMLQGIVRIQSAGTR